MVRKAAIFLLLFSLAAGFTFASEPHEQTTANSDDSHHESATEVTDSGHGQPDAKMQVGAIQNDAHGEEHGDSHAEDGPPSVMSILEHHLVDSHSYDLPWGAVALPVIPIAIPALGYDHGVPMTKHMLGLLVASLLVIVLVIPGMKKTRNGEVPSGIGNFFEMLVIFIRDDVVYANIGEKDGKKWLPTFLTVFFLILFSNLLGMVPWGTTPTANIAVTGGMAIAMLLAVIWAGIRAHGLKYLGTFVPSGVPIAIAPILFPIEIFGLFVKHFALAIRLFANMLAGHTIIAVFLALIMSPFIALASVPGAVAISMLELFVAFLQAYLFTMLASLFVGSSIHAH